MNTEEKKILGWLISIICICVEIYILIYILVQISINTHIHLLEIMILKGLIGTFITNFFYLGVELFLLKSNKKDIIISIIELIMIVGAIVIVFLG